MCAENDGRDAAEKEFLFGRIYMLLDTSGHSPHHACRCGAFSSLRFSQDLND